jgi:hypothetical protein
VFFVSCSPSSSQNTATHLPTIANPVELPWSWNFIHHRNSNYLLHACSGEQHLPTLPSIPSPTMTLPTLLCMSSISQASLPKNTRPGLHTATPRPTQWTLPCFLGHRHQHCVVHGHPSLATQLRHEHRRGQCIRSILNQSYLQLWRGIHRHTREPCNNIASINAMQGQIQMLCNIIDNQPPPGHAPIPTATAWPELLIMRWPLWPTARPGPTRTNNWQWLWHQQWRRWRWILQWWRQKWQMLSGRRQKF